MKARIDIVDELTAKQYNDLKKSLKKLDAGKRISHEEAMKRIRAIKK
jgi:hypothetical protein